MKPRLKLIFKIDVSKCRTLLQENTFDDAYVSVNTNYTRIFSNIKMEHIIICATKVTKRNSSYDKTGRV